MADPFLAEIRIFPYTFAPNGWAFCDGQLMPLSQNTALFALVGTIYGGDGKSTFALPDLRGRAAMHPGLGPGLSEYSQGQMGGAETVTLIESEIPAHLHTLSASIMNGTSNNAQNRRLAKAASGSLYKTAGTPNTSLNATSLTPAGGDLPHNNMQPYLTFNFCIALMGVFPQRP